MVQAQFFLEVNFVGTDVAPGLTHGMDGVYHFVGEKTFEKLLSGDTTSLPPCRTSSAGPASPPGGQTATASATGLGPTPHRRKVLQFVEAGGWRLLRDGKCVLEWSGAGITPPWIREMCPGVVRSRDHSAGNASWSGSGITPPWLSVRSSGLSVTAGMDGSRGSKLRGVDGSVGRRVETEREFHPGWELGWRLENFRTKF